MKRNIFVVLVYASAILCLGLIGLYVYLWIMNPRPQGSGSGMRWSSIAIVHGNPIVTTNYPSKRVQVDDPDSVYIAVAKNNADGMRDCYLYFFNQGVPYEYNFMFAPFVPKGLTNETRLNFIGFHFGSARHLGKMFGASDGNQTSEIQFIGHGIYFWEMKHTIEKQWNWWTLMISLWYPIILFGILPAFVLFNKWRRKNSVIAKDKTPS